MIATTPVNSIHKKLVTYSYNITGSYEDAKDLVQDVIEKFISIDKSHIENETNFLIKSVINHSINFKKKKAKTLGYGVWLPEPVTTAYADEKLISEDTARFSMMVLMENLSARERAVFVLKEGFDYSHEEIAGVLSITTENSRKVLSRAKSKLENKKFSEEVTTGSNETIDLFVSAIRDGDTKSLESLLSDDISLTADGGPTVKVATSITTGISNTAKLLDYVYNSYQKGLDIRLVTVNHQPALIYCSKNKIISCQVFEIFGGQIHRIFSIVDPEKLNNLF